MIRALNAGCGGDYRESTDEIEWWNVDSGNCKKDQDIDLESDIIPILGEAFDRIDAIQVLEHVDPKKFPNLIREFYRISKDGAEWNFAVPHGLSLNFVTDPTHKLHFSDRSFNYFIDGSDLRENGEIYGWGDIHLEHIDPPQMDGVQSIHFHLKVVKNGNGRV